MNAYSYEDFCQLCYCNVNCTSWVSDGKGETWICNSRCCISNNPAYLLNKRKVAVGELV